MAKAPIVVQWGTDTTAESKLRAMGVTYRYVTNVHVAEIDIKTSKQNNARIMDPYDESLVDEYAQSMLAEDIFPAIILVKKKRGKFLVLSGNHRLGAAIKNEQDTVCAYILDEWDDRTNELIARSANRWTGRRQDRDEAIQHARYLIRAYSMSVEEVAQALSLGRSALERSMRAEDVRDHLHELKVDASGFSISTLNTVNNLKQTPEIMAKAALVMADHSLSTERSSELVDKVFKAKSDDTREKAIVEFDEMLTTEAGRPKAPKTPASPLRTRFLRQLNSLHGNICNATDKSGKPITKLTQMQITSAEDRQLVKKRGKELIVKLTEITGVKV